MDIGSKKLFGISIGIVLAVIVANAVYDLFLGKMIEGIFKKNGYDNTFDPSGKSQEKLRALHSSRFVRGLDGKVYRVVENRFAA